ncbi:putative RNA-binding Zn ribbon-like protein [Streptosporangium album]|uniref:Putative RNA-binding Zn ribbon-like protein n=1 Tax=Streptosporangium album TaxID=47479 RepID=A0A7W7RX77_9ACTN|nr:ABATE domain-containing protein [Streptosporangium album]MBB4939707.1 putative RNA-binding Zn ribbon-like protein [Streptosporangium album]
MLVLEFVSTVRATRSGPLDTLSDVAGMTDWGRAHVAELGLSTDFTATEALRREVVELRQAVRALLAKAVVPGPVSSADADRLPGFTASVDLVNAAALAAPLAPRLDWPAEGDPSATSVPAGEAEESSRIRAALAASAIELLTGPHREQLRACPAPRCVLYFTKEHPRQEWCSVACGNRARAARHYHQHKGR